MSDTGKPAAMWRKILAAILDFITAFALFGYLVAKATGNTTDSGFKLDGTPALIMFALVIAYFVIGRRFLGGTIWQRILKAR